MFGDFSVVINHKEGADQGWHSVEKERDHCGCQDAESLLCDIEK